MNHTMISPAIRYGAKWGVVLLLVLSFLTMFTATGVYATTYSGIVLTSYDYGGTWTPRSSGTLENFHGIGVYKSIIGTDYWIVVGDSGTIVTSNDYGETWTPRNSKTAENLRSVCAYMSAVGHDYWVAVGDSGTIITSTDYGETWTLRDSKTTENLNGVCVWESNIGIAYWVIVGESGTVLISNDLGETWALRSVETVNNLRAVSTFKNDNGFDHWVAVGDLGTVMTSNNFGKSWTVRKSGTTEDLYGVTVFYAAGGHDRWVAVGDSGTVITSANYGKSWRLRDRPTEGNLRGVAVFKAASGYDHWVAVGESGTVLTSNDYGMTWDSQRSRTSEDLHAVTVFEMCGGYDHWVAVGGTPLPTMTSVYPAQGGQGEALSVTITGSYFTSASMVNFGKDIIVKSRTIDSPAQITASIVIEPDASAGLRDVSVTTQGGRSVLVNEFSVLYGTPTIFGVTPNYGCAEGFLTITVAGEYFTDIVTIDMGEDITVESHSIDSPTQMTANIVIGSDASAGERSVFVVTQGGIANLSDGFTVMYEVPSITSLEPSQGFAGDTLSLTITGEYFTEDSTVDMGADITVESYTIDSSTQIIASIVIDDDAAEGSRDVSITTTGGNNLLASGFAVTASVEEEEDDNNDYNGGLFGCSCNNTSEVTSGGSDLFVGWGIIGLCCGAAHYIITRLGRRKRHGNCLPS